MTESTVRTRHALLAVLLFGVAATLGATATVASFADSQSATGNVAAADDFGSAGPTADAGGPYGVDEGEQVVLDGSGSSANGGSIASYSWWIADGGSGSLSGGGTAQPTYHAPSNVEADANVTVELAVTDNRGNRDVDRATVTVRDVGAADVPAVDSLRVATRGPQDRELAVSTDVGDPADDGDQLASVRIEVVRSNKGKVDYSSTVGVAGDRATVDDRTGRLKRGTEYDVVVTVADGSGDESVATETVTTG